MTEICDTFDPRTRSAAVGLGRAAEVPPADLGDLVTVWWATRVVRLALTIAVVTAVCAVAAVAAPAGWRWGIGAALLVLLAASWLLCAHAGGHAWLVPLPALALRCGR